MTSLLYKKILVPVDFSACSENAVHYACEMALSLNATLYVYHAYHVPLIMDYYPEDVKDLAGKVKEEAEEQMQKVRSFIHRKYATLKTVVRIEHDLLIDGLTELVQKEKIDLIITGTKGASGMSEYLLGSNTARIIETIHCTVLAVPKNAIFKAPQKVLFATDFQFEDVKSITKMIELVGSFEPEIMIAHASTSPFTHDEMLMEWLSETLEERITYPKINYQNILKVKDNFSALNDYITSHAIDLVVMSTRNKNFMKKFFTGSLTKKMAYHTEIPLLAFHNEKENELS